MIIREKLFGLVGIMALWGGFSATVAAQSIPQDPYPDPAGHSCLIDRSVDATTVGKHKHAHRIPSQHRIEVPGDFIFKGPKQYYVLRFAACITEEYFNGFMENRRWNPGFGSDVQKVKEYWAGLEKYLNELYGRDCGVHFEVLRDEKLIFKKNPSGFTTTALHTYTGIINSLIGQDNYEIGLLLMPPSGGLNGRAALGGALSDVSKGKGRSSISYSVIAHEIGHLLGAEHTHQWNDAKITEQGNGFSIMSYGFPRTFFSLASIKSIRNTLSVMKYYTDEHRTHLVERVSDVKNAAYVRPNNVEVPVLNRDAIKKEYVITEGTRYQFYIPTKNKDTKNFWYHAHPYDLTLPGRETNLIQRLYDPSRENVVMYHPRCVAPRKEWVNGRESLVVDYLPHSAESKLGTYTYKLSAFNEGQHDVADTKLRIVPGKPFRVSQTSVRYGDLTAGKQIMTIKWHPCTDLYGTDSKVRVLLSTNFGKSFDYVLDDECPNNGVWTGVCPYVPIGRISHESTEKPIRGGVIKIEVIGEAAYALTEEDSYIIRSNVLPSGGFVIAENPIKFTPAPPIFKEVDGELPPREKLTATYNGQSREVTGSDKQVGNIVYRTWEAQINGVRAIYRQVIKLKHKEYILSPERTTASSLARRMTELYQSIGQLGYPKATLPLSEQFKQQYRNVYTDGGKLKANFTAQQMEELEKTLVAIGKITEDDVVMPIPGRKYKLASYHESYGKTRYHYLAANGTVEEQLYRDDPTHASVWTCEMIDGLYRFTSGEDELQLRQSNYGLKGFKVLRGYTWGSFCFVSGREYPRIAQVSYDGTGISFNESTYKELTSSYKFNRSGGAVSTDFRFFPVNEEFYVYYRTKKSGVPSAYFVASAPNGAHRLAAQAQPLTPVGKNLYKFLVPAGRGNEELVFVEGNQEQKVQLLGKTATYESSGMRVHHLALAAGQVASLHLDYPVQIPEGLKAYTASGTKAGNQYKLNLRRLSGKVLPAYTPVLVKGSGQSSYDLVEAENAPHAVEKGSLYGVIGAVQADDLDENYDYYPLTVQNEAQLRYTKATNIAEHTAYVRLSKYQEGHGISLVAIDNGEFSQLVGNGTHERPYTVADLKTVAARQNVWVRGRILGGWTSATSAASKAIGQVIALGEEGNAIPVHVPIAILQGVKNMKHAYLCVKGNFTSYEGSDCGLPENALTDLDYQEQIVMNEHGYATIYNPYAFVLPNGLDAALVVRRDNNSVICDWGRYRSGSIIPAETALVLKGHAGRYDVKPSMQTGASVKAEEANLLRGSLQEIVLTEKGYRYYKLNNGAHGVGFYFGTRDGSVLTSPARKAYLAIPTEMASSQAFSIEGLLLTNIDPHPSVSVADAKVYDLSGKLVGAQSTFDQLPAGVYVIQGKKVIK